MAEAAETLSPEGSALDLATDQAVEACDGDAWAAVRALLVANAALEEEVARLSARVSTGYARGRVRPATRSG
ncbi:hypothetical protein GCM10008171_01720 [Methylopila jiangsuensis]|uniref:Uncharacterized protein n=1 Tax=Methylopila jiangsuensis TaxID=586230 RepID=A0A9W6N1I5_9HYPH|nr:hypothetical protein [Methylopila jiangsuensis]MDR6287339.1 hypothetical protein [Methylopila jiangsuensis]GLK74919.1 hypothetical protein GCM10008171_01720 [Methylopila jiangsuensis]